MKPVPKEVMPHEGRAVRILWQDDHESIYSNAYLRENCQCAECIHEWTGEKLIPPGKISPDIRPVSVSPVGNYAISIHFSDGHQTGVYSFDLLRKICPCALCKAA
ncbi:MAG: DUF971 domain-containing protein [Leptospirillum sp.]|nr:DUF971 domain-containing protein [Nitrospiraceae bacterium]MDA8149539.1 DUF971 domain-containing protein [Nitrospiraceae bacterium]